MFAPCRSRSWRERTLCSRPCIPQYRSALSVRSDMLPKQKLKRLYKRRQSTPSDDVCDVAAPLSIDTSLNVTTSSMLTPLSLDDCCREALERDTCCAHRSCSASPGCGHEQQAARVRDVFTTRRGYAIIRHTSDIDTTVALHESLNLSGKSGQSRRMSMPMMSAAGLTIRLSTLPTIDQKEYLHSSPVHSNSPVQRQWRIHLNNLPQSKPVLGQEVTKNICINKHECCYVLIA